MKTAIKTPAGFQVIEAQPIQVLGLDLAIHRTPGKSGWSVTYPATGYALVSKQGTRELARSEALLRLNSYGVEKAVSLLDQHPKAPPVDTLPDYVEPPKAPAHTADIVKLVDLVAKTVGGLSEDEKQAVARALNSRTGRLKAKSPSAFGDAAERLACAAWQGLQPNGFKLGTFSIMSLRGEASKLYEKLSAVQWPDAFDKDKSALVAAGVW